MVMSELMSNGVLHARTEMSVVISRRGKGLRLEVHDDSPAPLLPPPTLIEGPVSLLDEPLQLELIGRLSSGGYGQGARHRERPDQRGGGTPRLGAAKSSGRNSALSIQTTRGLAAACRNGTPT